MIDNFDSFTFILVDYLKQLNCEVIVVKNTINIYEIDFYNFDLLVISPGPSEPSRSGNLLNLIDKAHHQLPVFGVCLGLQALVEFFGGSIEKKNPQHGKKDEIWVDQRTIFKGLPSKIEIGRYHSLAVKKLPDCFEISSKSTSDQTIMGIRHKTLLIEAVQFHPESVLSMKSNVGFRIIENVVGWNFIS